MKENLLLYTHTLDGERIAWAEALQTGLERVRLEAGTKIKINTKNVKDESWFCEKGNCKKDAVWQYEFEIRINNLKTRHTTWRCKKHRLK